MGNGRVWPVWWLGMGMWFVWRDPGYILAYWETRGIYWCIAMIDERGETKPPRQPRPESTGESSGHEPHKHTQATHMRAHHITCQLITRYHNETRRNSMNAFLSIEFYTNTYLVKTFSNNEFIIKSSLSEAMLNKIFLLGEIIVKLLS